MSGGGVVGSMAVKLSAELIKAGQRRTNSSKTDAAYEEAVLHSVLESHHRLRQVAEQVERLPDFIRLEVKQQLAPVLEGIRVLNELGRLDAFSGSSALELLADLVEEVGKTRSERKQDSLHRAFVRQFDEDAGSPGSRNVWWTLLLECEDSTVEVLGLLADGPVLHDELNSRLFRGGRDAMQGNGIKPGVEALELSQTEVDALAASLKRAATKHGVIQTRGHMNYHSSTELLESCPGGPGYCRDYRLTKMGAALCRFLAEAPLPSK